MGVFHQIPASCQYNTSPHIITKVQRLCMFTPTSVIAGLIWDNCAAIIH